MTLSLIHIFHLAMSRLLENGITTVAAIEGGWLFDDRDAEFIYAHSGEFPVDMPLFYQTMDLAKVWKLGLRRVGGNIMVDGTLSSHSAALSAPYADRPDYRGQIFLPQDGLDEFVQQCYRQDMQLALYSIDVYKRQSLRRARTASTVSSLCSVSSTGITSGWMPSSTCLLYTSYSPQRGAVPGPERLFEVPAGAGLSAGAAGVPGR